MKGICVIGKISELDMPRIREEWDAEAPLRAKTETMEKAWRAKHAGKKTAKPKQSKEVKSWMALFEKEQADKKAELEAARLKTDLQAVEAGKRKAKAGKA